MLPGTGTTMDLDLRVRLAAFDFLERQTALHGEVLPRDVLRNGFTFEGRQVRLIGPQGIFKPRILPEIPISITTAPPKRGMPPPYDDGLRPDGLLAYRYRGTDPDHHENVGLRLAMRRNLPLIYHFGIVPGRYLPVWPVYIVGDERHRLTFTVAVDDHRLAAAELKDATDELRRSYVTRVTLQRMHQTTFRERVLRAYREQCAVCRLRHAELLEAAHIIPDRELRGEPIVPNGLALCKLHHAAFDRHILGVRPDLVIEIRRDILEEVDGPMLRHGLQEMQGRRLHAPRAAELRPRPEFLEERYARFRKAG
ncbi:MAG TPA: HNH endonuclease [Longimicrobiales bacterium]